MSPPTPTHTRPTRAPAPDPQEDDGLSWFEASDNLTPTEASRATPPARAGGPGRGDAQGGRPCGAEEGAGGLAPVVGCGRACVLVRSRGRSGEGPPPRTHVLGGGRVLVRARVPGGGRGREAGRFKGRDARACFCLTIRLSHSPLISSLSLSPLFPGRARPRGQVARMLRVNAELVVALNQRAVKGLTRASRLRQVGE